MDGSGLGASLTGKHRTSVLKMPSSEALRMGEDEDVKFDSPQEEAAHYREKYRRILDMLDETRAELDEFQASSKELEDELEKELSATEKQQAELKEKIKRLEAEKDEWKEKHIALQKMHSSSTSAMQREMDNLRSERDKTLVALRDLEMGNDELERNERVAVSSLLDLESKYNRAIEEKTMLEQEVVQREELEVDCQRLKDEVRDANNEIAMLREQLSRGFPTPPSSVSIPDSPAQPASQLPPIEPAINHVDSVALPERHSPPRTAFPRSNTTQSISSMAASPSVRRTHTGMTKSPSGLPSLARSTNTRNLANVAGPSSPSPFARANSISRNAKSPAPPRVVSANSSKTKGFKLLHELQARLKATDDKLGTKVPKRNVSNPMPLAPTNNRNVSAVSAPSASSIRAPHSRVQALAGDTTPSTTHEKSSILSPNGWVMVDDEHTPTAQISRNHHYNNPGSPLDTMHVRAASQASQASQKSTSSRLPARPGIPSPLTGSTNGGVNPLSKSTTRLPQRTPSRAGISNLSQSVRPQSRTGGDRDRPISPSMIPRPPSSLMNTLASASPSASYSRPTSSSAHRSIGRGPPPKAFPGANPIKSSISTSAASNSALRRSTRRSSVGAPPAELAVSTGLPQPRTPNNRPVSVPVFDGTPPPPVPRIPSVHLRESKRGADGMDRRKSMLNG